MPVRDVSVGPPWRVRFRALRSAEDVVVCVDADRSVTVIAVAGSEDLLPGAALLAALGAEPPAWAPYVEMVDQALAAEPSLSAETALEYMLMSVAKRKTFASRVLDSGPDGGELTVGQAWLFAFDPERRIRNLLAEHFPSGEAFVPVAVAMLGDVERTRNKVLSGVDWSPVMDRVAARHADPEVRAAFVRRHGDRVPADLHTVLAGDPDGAVRYMLASHVRLDESLVEVLARDTDRTVRDAVARFQKVGLELAKEMVADDQSCRSCLLSNPRISVEVVRFVESTLDADDWYWHTTRAKGRGRL